MKVATWESAHQLPGYGAHLEQQWRAAHHGEEKQGRQNDSGQEAGGEEAGRKRTGQEAQGWPENHEDIEPIRGNIEDTEAVSRRPFFISSCQAADF